VVFVRGTKQPSKIEKLGCRKTQKPVLVFAGTVSNGIKSITGLYNGVVGAASGAGIYIGAYFAFYGAACNLLTKHTNMSPGAVAFIGGGIAAAGGSVVKVPLAVCIRWVCQSLF
jgi:hypothetical protein